MSLEVEKIVFGGQALAHQDGTPLFLWNALPGEHVEFERTRKKGSHIEGIATQITNPSSARVEPREDHYLSCSPWQMMSWDLENQLKVQIAQETYSRIGAIHLPDLQLTADESLTYGYRNKMEFSFVQPEGESVSLAFFKRGTKWRYAIDGCALAEPVINAVAQEIMQWVLAVDIPIRSLKSLIVRSNGAGKAIAALFIKDKLEFEQYPKLTEKLLGFHIFYSTHKSPASVPTELLYSSGAQHLLTDLGGVTLKFGLLSFFQVHIPMFTRALNDFAQWILPDVPLVDYYSGVGAISLPMASHVPSMTLVDNNAEAIAYAQDSITQNSITNATANCVPAERSLDVLADDQTVILDPPRAGLHKHLIGALLHSRPKRILYLSCNLATQARDLQLLQSAYTIVHSQLYNFFPRTPHIEGFCVLDRV